MVYEPTTAIAVAAATISYILFLVSSHRFTDHWISSLLTTLIGAVLSYIAYHWTGSWWWAPLPFIFFLQHRFLGMAAALASHAFLVWVLTLLMSISDLSEAIVFVTVSWLYAMLLGRIRLVETLSQYFKISLIVGLIFYLAFVLGHWVHQALNISVLGWGLIYAGGQIMVFLLGFSLYFLYEMWMGRASPLKLMELADMKHPLLQRLRDEAPGTFQHSLGVATLAQEAAHAIGANERLVYVGALFHDVGKLSNPKYFIENFMGEVNPHHSLSPEKSAEIIIDHVSQGVKLAQKHGLPSWIIDFIRTHHGTSRVEYFYRQFFTSTGIEDDSRFRYPGPRPHTMEQAILMLADSIEAASRSKAEWMPEEIEQLVHNIFHQKVADAQLEDAPLSFPQLKKLQQVMTRRLQAILHKRTVPATQASTVQMDSK